MRVLLLDPAHGGTSLGLPVPGGLWESAFTFDWALRVRELLTDFTDVRVRLTRALDETMSVRKRALAAGAVDLTVHLGLLPAGAKAGVVSTREADEPLVALLCQLHLERFERRLTPQVARWELMGCRRRSAHRQPVVGYMPFGADDPLVTTDAMGVPTVLTTALLRLWRL